MLLKKSYQLITTFGIVKAPARFFMALHPFTSEDRYHYKKNRGLPRVLDKQINQKFQIKPVQPQNSKTKRVGLIAYKQGMTHIYDKWGVVIPITVLQVDRCQVVQVKTADKQGLTSLQLGAGEKNLRQVKKSQVGHFARADVPPKRNLKEFRVTPENILPVGYQLSVLHFRPGQWVDCQSLSKGKGTQGTIKRWNFHSQPATHGNSKAHRKPGSIGQRQFPGKVFKGKKMAGRMGFQNSTIQSLKVIRCDLQRSLIYVRGGVPGWIGGTVYIKDAVKKIHKQFRTLYYPTYTGQQINQKYIQIDPGSQDPMENYKHDNDEVVGPQEKDDDD